MFYGCTVLPDSKETKLGSSDKEASPLAGKNAWVVLMPHYAWKCVPTTISGGLNISEVPGYHFLWLMSSQWGSQRLLQELLSHELTAWTHQFLTQWIIVISKGCKPDNVELHKSLKLNCTNTRGRCSNFVEHEPFLESNSPDTLALFKTSLDDSIDSGTLSVMGYLP